MVSKPIHIIILFLSLLVVRVGYAQTPDALLKVGDVPPKFDLVKLLQAPIDTVVSWELFKNEVVVLDFWATWCVPCWKSFPHLNELVGKFKGKPVRFISVTYEDETEVKSFLGEHKLKTWIGIDNDFSMFRSFNAWGIPHTVLVKQDGIVAGVIHPNYISEDAINDILAGKIPALEQKGLEGYFEPKGAEEYFRSLNKKGN